MKSSKGEISYHAKDILFKSMSGIYKDNMLKYIEYSIRIIDKYLREEKIFKKVYVAVVYTSNIERATNVVSFGSTNIEVKSVFMKNFNGDEILKEIENKIINGVELSSKDKMKLILIPLMKSDKDKHEVIEHTIELAKLIEDDYEQCAIINL